MRKVAIRSDLFFEDKDTRLLVPEDVNLEEEFEKMNALNQDYLGDYPYRSSRGFVRWLVEKCSAKHDTYEVFICPDDGWKKES